MFCPKCGTQLPDGSRFCGACGHRLPLPVAAAPGAAPAPSESAPAEIGPENGKPAGNRETVRKPEESREETEKNPAVPAASGGPEKPGGGKKKLLIAAAIAIAVVICIIVAVMLLTGRGGNAGSAETISGSTWQEQYDLGVRYLEALDYEAAIVAFTEAIAIDPKQTGAYLGRAEAYLAAGDTEDYLSAALTDYQTVLELDADQIDVYIEIGNIYIQTEDYEAAVEAYTGAIDAGSQNPAAWSGRAEAYLAADDTEESQEAALADYRQAVELDENQPDIWQKIAEICMQRGEYEEAAEAFTRAIETGAEENAAVYAGRAEAYLAADDTEELQEAALADYQRAVELDENRPDIWQKIAEICMQRGEYEEAAEAFTRAIETGAEEDAAVYAGRAEAYLAADDTEENRAAALEDLLTALALRDPDTEPDPDLYALATELLLDQGNCERALELLTEALDAGAEEAFLYTLRGNVWQAMAEADPEQADTCLEAALADYEAAAELDGENVEAWTGIAAVYTAQGRASEAITLLDQILTAGLWDTDLYLARGDAYLALEQTQENLAAAFENYRTVTILSPELEEGYLKAAEVCALQGDTEGAQTWLENGAVSAESVEAITAMLSESAAAEPDVEIYYDEDDAEFVQVIQENHLDRLVAAAQLLEEDLTALRPFLYTRYADVAVDVGMWDDGFDLLGEDLEEIMDSLSAAIRIRLDNGYYLGVYKKGIYYGEMSGGIPSGYGLWFSKGETKVGYYIPAYLGDWADGLPNGQGIYTGSSYAGSSGIMIFSIGFVDGLAQGEGTYYNNTAYSSEGITYSCAISAEDGYLNPQYTYDGSRYAVLYTSSSGRVMAYTTSNIGSISLTDIR